MTEERKQALMHSGIAVHECIARLGGNERLYERVLSTYLRDTNAESLEKDSDPQDCRVSNTCRDFHGFVYRNPEQRENRGCHCRAQENLFPD